MAIEATVAEDFTALSRMKKGQSPEKTAFQKGDKLSLLEIWEGELCLIKHPEGKVFNIKKTLLNKEAFAQSADKDKGKTRRKKAGDIPDYTEISNIRPDLDMERGLAPALSKAVERTMFRGILDILLSKTGGAVAAIIIVLAVYAGWQNIQKSRNHTPTGRLASVVLERGSLHEPGHFQPSFRALKLPLNGSKAEAFVRDSLLGQRILTLKVPGKKSAILANEQEARWLNSDLLKSFYFDEYVDVGSDGEVDKVLQVLEFWSDGKRLVGAYRKTISHNESHNRIYNQNIQKIVKTLSAGN